MKALRLDLLSKKINRPLVRILITDSHKISKQYVWGLNFEYYELFHSELSTAYFSSNIQPLPESYVSFTTVFRRNSFTLHVSSY